MFHTEGAESALAHVGFISYELYSEFEIMSHEYIIYTLPETNIAPTRRPAQKEINPSSNHLICRCFFGVFKEGRSENIF